MALYSLFFIIKFAWFYYENEFGQKIVGEDPGLSWTRQFVEARRQFLESWQSTETIAQWMNDSPIHMEQYIITQDRFKSFNQFFIRDLKPGMRTVSIPLDDSVLVSPNDCVLNMIEPLTPCARITMKLQQKHTLNLADPWRSR
ncbi:MAG TPA: phosphatidylserine decarboxylase [Methanothrix sp.]|nr:phosphatidylserine decarboxylase [Methanothrix sp.]